MGLDRPTEAAGVMVSESSTMEEGTEPTMDLLAESTAPTLSVVVPAFDEEDTIAACLERLTAQADCIAEIAGPVTATVKPLCLYLSSVVVLLACSAALISTDLAAMAISPLGAFTSLPTCV